MMMIDELRYALAKQVLDIARSASLQTLHGPLCFKGYDAEKIALLVQKLLKAQLKKAERQQASR